jgi:hypothetical protein
MCPYNDGTLQRVPSGQPVSHRIHTPGLFQEKSVRAEKVSVEQIADIVCVAVEQKQETTEGLTARWLQMPEGDQVVLVEGLSGGLLFRP